MTRINDFFTEEEFACKCGCGQTIINDKLIAILTDVREYFDSPLTINSGNRCMSHNVAVGGSGASQHLFGTAADIVVKDVSPQAVYAYVELMHAPPGLGKYGTFTHVDTRLQGPARWFG